MRLEKTFFERDVLDVAPEMLGMTLVRKIGRQEVRKSIVTEVEAYRGEEDLACHARFGRTKRTEALYGEAGTIYVYLIYGMYWMLNIVTGKEGEPQAILIRGLEVINGPGRVGKFLNLDKSFYGENITSSQRLWLAESDSVALKNFSKSQAPRIGVDYAGDWAKKPWRFILSKNEDRQ